MRKEKSIYEDLPEPESPPSFAGSDHIVVDSAEGKLNVSGDFVADKAPLPPVPFLPVRHLAAPLVHVHRCISRKPGPKTARISYMTRPAGAARLVLERSTDQSRPFGAPSG